MTFNNIHIQNFRGFDNLQINKIAKVNVLVGANNVGKTSLLEAVFMLTGMSNPICSVKIDSSRKSSKDVSIDELRYIFHNVDFSDPVLLSANTCVGDRRLRITPILRYDDKEMSVNTAQRKINKLQFDFDTTNNPNEYSYHSDLTQDVDGNFKNNKDENYTESLTCIFVPTERQDRNALNSFSHLVKLGKKQDVINRLQMLNADIESIEALPEGLFLKYRGVRELLPIEVAGDGIRRIINIISTIATNNYDVVLIDEFDNGLHYSAHKMLWKAVLDYSQHQNIQIFATTHNIECLESLSKAIDEMQIKEDEDIVAVCNVMKTKENGFKVYRYNSKDLKEAIDNEIEIRK